LVDQPPPEGILGAGLRDAEPAHVFDQLTPLIQRYLDVPDDVVGIGVAVAGPIIPDEGMLRTGPEPGPWDTVDFAKEIHQRLPEYDFQVEVANDANVGALFEHRLGAARDADDVVYVHWSAGVGVGLILAGKLYAGARGIAGELGHIVAPNGNVPQQNGVVPHENGDFPTEYICDWCKNTCVQVLAGTDAIIADAKKHSAALAREETVAISDVISAAPNDPAARQAVTKAAQYIGRCLAIVVDLLNPQLVVLGGAFGRDDYSLVVPEIQQAMRGSTIQPAFKDARIVMARFGGDLGDSVLRGAATAVFDKHLARWLLRP
jgi:predicted NBD/HSP70 family sugar kinase